MMMPSIFGETYLMIGWISRLRKISLVQRIPLRKTCEKYDENRCPRDRRQLRSRH